MRNTAARRAAYIGEHTAPPSRASIHECLDALKALIDDGAWDYAAFEAEDIIIWCERLQRLRRGK